MKSQMQRLVTGVLMLAFAVPPAIAAQAAESRADARAESDRPQSEEEFYAKDLGVSIGEALRRMAIMEGMGEINIELEREFAPRMAGLYLDHVPELRIVVRLTGDATVPARRLETAAGTFPIVFTTGARATLKEVEAALDTHQSALVSMLPSLQGMHADVRTGEIVLAIHAVAPESDAYLAEAPRLQELLGHPVRYEFLPAPMCKLICPDDAQTAPAAAREAD